MIKASAIKYIDDIDIVDVINIISLNRFNDGGAAILIEVNRNHHMVKIGAVDIIPFIRNILRV